MVFVRLCHLLTLALVSLSSHGLNVNSRLAGEALKATKAVKATEAATNVCCDKAKAVFNGTGEIPFPRIILLGATGVGKSTLGNQLLGSHNTHNSYSSHEEWLASDCNVMEGKPFSVGHTLSSHTADVSFTIGAFAGNPEQCVTIIDTQGFADTKGRDARFIQDLATTMTENITSVNVFLLLFKGSENRFNKWTQDQLLIYESIFGPEFWRHAMTEFTFWSHSRRDNWNRERACQMDPDCDASVTPEQARHLAWNRAYRSAGLAVPRDLEVPTVFIDPVLPIFSTNPEDIEFTEENEIHLFEEYTNQLLEFAKSQPPFECKGNCKAPSGSYIGAPWIQNNLVQERAGAAVSLHCQVWTKFNSEAAQGIHWTFKGQTIHTLPDDPDLIGKKDQHSHQSSLSHEGAIRFVDKYSALGLGVTSTLVIESLDKALEGEYACLNGIESDNVENEAQVLLITDCVWNNWEPWSSCSKSCVQDVDMSLGTAQRNRTFVEPTNGGLNCDESKAIEVRNCPRVDDEDITTAFIFCPVDAQWGDYSDWSDWRSCSATCGGGEKWRSRHRSCTSGRHGGIANCDGSAEDVEKEPCNTYACPPPVVQKQGSSLFEKIVGTLLTGAIGQAFGEGGGVNVKITDEGTEAVFNPAPTTNDGSG